MRQFVSTSVLILGALVFPFARQSSAMGPTMLSYPHSITVTTDTLVQSRAGTDSLVLELPYHLWTKTPVHIVSNIVDVEWIEFGTGMGTNCWVITVDTGFRKESLKGRVEYKVSFLDADGKVMSSGRHIAEPRDYVPVDCGKFLMTLSPVLFATARVPPTHSRSLSAYTMGVLYTVHLPTNWVTCRIGIRPGPPGKRQPEDLGDGQVWLGWENAE